MQFRFRTICLILSFVFLLGCGTTTRHQPVQQTSTQNQARAFSSVSLSTPDLRQFAGKWIAHGSILIISSDGTATFSARAYRWCGVGVPQPCDTMDARGNIQNGDQEQVSFTRVSGSVAYGTVLASTFHPTGLPVTLTLEPDDTILYAANTPISFLCGPSAPAGTCGA